MVVLYQGLLVALELRDPEETLDFLDQQGRLVLLDHLAAEAIRVSPVTQGQEEIRVILVYLESQVLKDNVVTSVNLVRVDRLDRRDLQAVWGRLGIGAIRVPLELPDCRVRVVLLDRLDRLEFKERLVQPVVPETQDQLEHLVHEGTLGLVETLVLLDLLEAQVLEEMWVRWDRLDHREVLEPEVLMGKKDYRAKQDLKDHLDREEMQVHSRRLILFNYLK